MSYFKVLQKLPDGWYRISIAVRPHCWVMEQDESLWKWPKEYNSSDYVNVSPELLVLLRLKYHEFK